MKLYNQAMKYYLQYFADGDDNQDDSSADDQGADDNKKSEVKTFTQEDVDKMITERLKRERAKEKKAREKQEKGEDPDAAKLEAERKQAEKVSALEARLLCFEHDVAKDAVSDVVALAKSYVDDETDFEEAIEKVIKKYPSFVNGADSGKGEASDDDGDKKSWGTRQKGKPGNVDGVEAAFLKKNPGLKLN